MSNHSNLSDGIEFGELTRAAEGLTQWRTLLVGFGSLLLSGVLIGVSGSAMASLGSFFGFVLAGLLVLAALIVMLGGFSAVGVMLMDKARNLPARSLGDAVMLGLLCIPRFLLFALLLVAIGIVVGLVAGLLYLLCKLPYIGAVLAFFVHPALVLVTAFLFLSIMFVAIPLFAPAVWSGLSFRQALTSLVAVARKRMVQVVLMLIVLYLIVSVIVGLLFVGLLPASTMMSVLAASIVSSQGFYGGMMAFPMGGFGSGAMVGGGAGMAVLAMVVAALITQVWVMGLNLMYVQAVKGVDLSVASEDLGKVMDTIKNRAEAAKESAVAAAARAQQVAAERAAAAKAAQTATQPASSVEQQAASVSPAIVKDASESVTTPPAAAAQLHCPACQAVVQSHDAFCGECGQKLGS